MANVSTAKPKVGGAVYVGATTATLPTDTTTALTGFTSLGYISDAGLTNDGSISVDNIKAWGGDIVMTTQTEKVDTFQFALLESLNINVLQEIYGSENVTGSLADGIKIAVNSDAHPARAWAIDMALVDDSAKRITIPNGMITAIDSITYSDSEAIAYNITVTALPDASGNTHYEYIKA